MQIRKSHPSQCLPQKRFHHHHHLKTLRMVRIEILVTGIGGTGVVSTSQILGMAAFLDGRQVAVLDEIGLSQKNGGVVSQINIGQKDDEDVLLISSKIDEAETNLLLGLDMDDILYVGELGKAGS